MTSRHHQADNKRIRLAKQMGCGSFCRSFRRQRQEDYYKFQMKLVCRASLKLARATYLYRPVSKIQKGKTKQTKKVANLCRLLCAISLHTQIIPRTVTVKIPLHRLGK